jgi:hypothetical protein
LPYIPWNMTAAARRTASRKTGARVRSDKSSPRALRPRENWGRMTARDIASVKRGLRASARGDGIVLTAAEEVEYERTGIPPQRVERWLAARGV